MRLELDLQNVSEAAFVPARADLLRWVTAVLSGRRQEAELSIRMVDMGESAELNGRYRGKIGPTNVLSFPFEPPPGLPPTPLLGDLVVCAPVVAREAREQGKALNAHWAHIVVHGVLHLLGYDHADDTEAAEMEGVESRLLCGLGFPHPYEVEEGPNDQ
jgi:probable rRNA maturation factor